MHLTSSVNPLTEKEKFIRNYLYSCKTILKDKDFEEFGLKEKNMMFFLNSITDKISSISMLGTRNFGASLIGKLTNIIDYYNGIHEQFEKSEKIPTIPKFKIEYIRKSVENNIVLNENVKKNYLIFLKPNDDRTIIENIKLIKNSIISNSYFETISDKIYDIIVGNEKIDFDYFEELINEYISLLIDYVGISIFEIKRILKDAYRDFIEKKDKKVFYRLLEYFSQGYKNENQYYIFVKTNKDFDNELVQALKLSKNDNYIIYSKVGLLNQIDEIRINNQKTYNKIIEEDFRSIDNKYYIFASLKSKDTWNAMRTFRQKVMQPFIGSMLYSGIRINSDDKYYVIECRENKKFINSYKFHDDIFKPLSQDRISYLDVFKRYIIEQSDNCINDVIDEAVQLLPYYSSAESTLTKFSNTWFALESLYRNANDRILTSLDEYASCLVADRMIAGYIYVISSQIKKNYSGFENKSNIFVENMILNYIDNECDKSVYLDYKIERLKYMTNNYKKTFDFYRDEAQRLLDDAYRVRNKQFHGKKDSKLENLSGLIYDIVNDTISFYIDYLDVYKDCNPNFDGLFNYIKNIYEIKNSILKNNLDFNEKIVLLYDSVRKL